MKILTLPLSINLRQNLGITYHENVGFFLRFFVNRPPGYQHLDYDGKTLYVHRADVAVGSWGSARWRESAAETTVVPVATWEPAVAQQRHFPAWPTPTADWPASSPAPRESPATNCCAEGPAFPARSTTAGTVHPPWSWAAASEPWHYTQHTRHITTD